MDNRRAPYPNDLTDAQWKRIAPLIPPARPGGRPRTVNIREIVNAICYLSRTGCAWRLLPHDFPPWGTVHYYFRRWRLDGTWERIHDALRMVVRRAAGREVSPSAAIIDSQSVKTTEKGDHAALMLPRRSRDANGIWQWIRSA
jgi:putative transposase